jgi:hypothetical protein
MRNAHAGPVRRSATIAVFSLLMLATGGCAAGRTSSASGSLRAPGPRPAVVFENAGSEPVKVYLAERGNEWFVGYVLPGRTEVLPLPPTIGASPVGHELTLVVVPSTAARFARRDSGALPGVITSEAFTTDYLTSIRWRVVGRWVVAMP